MIATFLLRTLIALAVLVSAASSAEAKLVAILNKRNPTKKIDAATVRNIFLGQKSFWKGTVPVRVLARGREAPSSDALVQLLGMTESQFEAHWTKRQLSGKGVKPKTVDSIEELLKVIRKTPTAVSIVLEEEIEGADLKGIKILPIR